MSTSSQAGSAASAESCGQPFGGSYHSGQSSGRSSPQSFIRPGLDVSIDARLKALTQAYDNINEAKERIDANVDQAVTRTFTRLPIVLKEAIKNLQSAKGDEDGDHASDCIKAVMLWEDTKSEGSDPDFDLFFAIKAVEPKLQETLTEAFSDFASAYDSEQYGTTNAGDLMRSKINSAMYKIGRIEKTIHLASQAGTTSDQVSLKKMREALVHAKDYLKLATEVFLVTSYECRQGGQSAYKSCAEEKENEDRESNYIYSLASSASSLA